MALLQYNNQYFYIIFLYLSPCWEILQITKGTSSRICFAVQQQQFMENIVKLALDRKLKQLGPQAQEAEGYISLRSG